MARDRLHLSCPHCSARLTVDASTGDIVAHEAPQRPAGGGKDFDTLLKGLDEGKARAEALFEQEKAALADRGRLLEEKFEEAKKRAEKEGLDGPPPRPWDLD